MKYLALLRDSFREALDTKVVYFTFGLSALLIFILFSVSYRPVTVREEVELECSKLNLIFGFQESGPLGLKPPRYELTHFEQLNPADKPWEADYRFTITLTMPKGSFDSQEGRQKKTILYLIFNNPHGEFWWLKDLQMTEQPLVRSGEEDRVDFLVTSRGTKINDLQHWRHEASLFFGLLPMSWFRSSLTGSVYWIEDVLVNNVGGWVIILIAVIVTAFFIPNMLQKGSVDLLLVKPITRVSLLLFKYLGGLTFVLVNSLVAILGVWLVLGLRTGIWTYGFPLSALVLTFFFAILYSVSTLFGVLTRNSVLAIFMTCLVWFGLFVLGQVHATLNADIFKGASGQVLVAETGKKPPAQTVGATDPVLEQVTQVVNVAHAVLPRTNDLGHLTTRLIGNELLSEEERKKSNLDKGNSYNWGESLGVSLAFIAVMLALACWRFAVRDY